ncbi:MAG: dihydroneopterin aldolase [Candidatus Thermoplasmatota archaeon]|nr:dihydroneopterin aldolase [Euryarchaeota archaeon]MEC7703853.1 dihydroneopterin aldolase [Candidatus Thermoplasmatota archaeon]MEC9090152.1 dihydroneopterin aldolase [Candidatus Thermoplasmatota archaeon]|tara:strand:- start:537 stop:905 length:369 start_codon:yes stop_codon:yes gene_type:complete
MSTIVAVENYKVKGKHGVFDHEREKDQPFIVSVWVVLKESAKDDDIGTSVDYGFLQRVVHDVISRGESVHMMETLSDKIIETISGHLNVAGVKIRIEKPQAPMPHDGGLAVVERTWPEGLTF